ncbi:hypothetical protein TURU_093430 [Turdus rufiventris]|nr:hypothetical protein TURU_093430 [Turdus rufiventris]
MEEYRHAACHCRKKIHSVKAQLELKLAKNAVDNKKTSIKYINGKSQCRSNISPLQDEDGHLTNRDMDRAEVLNAFFVSVLNTDDAKGVSAPELEDHDYENDQVPVNPEIVYYLLFQLNPYRSMGTDRINPKILKELSDVTTKPLDDF